MSSSKSKVRTATLKAKTVSVSSPDTSLQARRAERSQANAQLIGSAASVTLIANTFYKAGLRDLAGTDWARYFAKLKAERPAITEAEALALLEGAAKATVAARIAQIQADAEADAKAKAGDKPVAKAAIVVPQLPPPLPAAAYRSPSGILPQASDGNVVAVQPKLNGSKEPAKVEPLAEAQTFELPVKFLEAALVVVPKKDVRFYLNGVHIHQLPSGVVRVVATDGHRMLVISLENIGRRLDWAEGNGIILPGAELTRIARYLGKDASMIAIKYGVGHPAVTVSEVGDNVATFSVQPIDGKYPDYQRLVDQSAKVFTAERQAMETTCLNSDYLKSAGIVAAKLDAKGLMPFMGDSKDTVVFSFSGCAEAMFYISPMVADADQVSAPALRMFSKSASAELVAQLRDQAKKCTANAKTAKHEKFRELFKAKAARLTAKADSIQAAIAVKIEAPAKSVPADVKVIAPTPAVAAAVATAKAVTTASVH